MREAGACFAAFAGERGGKAPVETLPSKKSAAPAGAPAAMRRSLRRGRASEEDDDGGGELLELLPDIGHETDG